MPYIQRCKEDLSYSDFICGRSNNYRKRPKMFLEFKKAMVCMIEMTDIEFTAFYLGIEISQKEEDINIS